MNANDWLMFQMELERQADASRDARLAKILAPQGTYLNQEGDAPKGDFLTNLIKDNASDLIREGVFEGASGSGALANTAAQNALWNAGATAATESAGSALASTAAQNALWNAGADAATASAAETAGLSSLGSVAVPAAFLIAMSLAAPSISKHGKRISKALLGDKPERDFNLSELTTRPERGTPYLEKQIPGFYDKPQEEKESLINQINQAGLFALPGYKGEDGRSPEFINWAHALKPTHEVWGEMDASRRREQFNPMKFTNPTTEDIDKAYWLKQGKKDELKGILNALAG